MAQAQVRPWILALRVSGAAIGANSAMGSPPPRHAGLRGIDIPILVYRYRLGIDAAVV
jgi:hypothetical protein